MLSRNKTRFVTVTALTASALLVAALGLSACGKWGTLEQAPPLYGAKAKADWSTSRNPDGGITTTTSASSSRASERALPDKNAKNKMPNPYAGTTPISAAPLEGVGNAEGH
jgi:hypothetical protein